ncbi:error-prone DNA polymerase [Sedimenticola selenatireducens]|uniref:Error-prone DNA polymerase n=1 Tax=Sedimenticola selenatireducens TaxID=191960 RepID=A0A2N6CZX3_9GAMM|nr:error-prone DNA polymerase [Sedimenticola selenatireducens]PLX62961.1 MAG: error-prone DNA polymerase [Sedimenticola selenatireducens]
MSETGTCTAVLVEVTPLPVEYAELHCLSNFSFLRGASHPEELVAQATGLGYRALALTDECSLAGVVRAHEEARAQELPLIIGSEFRLEEGDRLVLLATDRQAYAELSALITRARRAADKGPYRLAIDGLDNLPGCLVLLHPDNPQDQHRLTRYAECFGGRLWLEANRLLTGDEPHYLRSLRAAANHFGLPIVAAGDVHMHRRERQRLQDLVTAIRHRTTLARAGWALYPNAERHLRPLATLLQIYPRKWLQQSCAIAERCCFSLDELRYEYPDELVPEGLSPAAHLRTLTEAGMQVRWPDGGSRKVRDQIEHELQLIGELNYEPYFLTVHDIVRFARERGILCQGRGSAANSAVCYALGITEVDPARLSTLFERFISKERNEPPDIDVDFEHQRREEVIQYIYEKYGRHRAALAATVITYRTRSALRETGKALGFDSDTLERLATTHSWWDGRRLNIQRIRELGFDPEQPQIRQLLGLTTQLIGFPRHLSQHVGGFVIAQKRLDWLVPIENAAMPERTVIQWDKDDLRALGLLKIDVLALGMLSAIRRSLALISDYRREPFRLQDIPPEDPATYAMISKADTVGVFQIESRAQMTMLPRLRPACFYDLVIEVAIVRPGPIQGDMVHPYLRRRQGLELVEYPSPAVRSVLERTLGGPLFQEQAIELAMVAAGFSAGEADALRRAMAAWRRRGGIEVFQRKLFDGMRQRGYSEEFAGRIFDQIKGFSEYGFPESHAASFALLAYASAWLKCHHPAAFFCGLLNSQPMGFYAPAQLIQDARRRGVRVHPVDVRRSNWDSSLEPGRGARPELRLGLHLINELSCNGAARLVEARQIKAFADITDLSRRARLNERDLQALAAADALAGLGGHRYQAQWQVLGVEEPTPLFAASTEERGVALPEPTLGEAVCADYDALGLSLRRHPLQLLRTRLRRAGVRTAAEVQAARDRTFLRSAGLVICRQRPHTASGVMFATLEDESGQINLVIWPKMLEHFRQVVLSARLLLVNGQVQREGQVVHLIAHKLEDRSNWLGELNISSRDFR